MGRTILADDGVQTTIDAQLAREKCQVGLIIGQMTNQKDFAVHLARTPNETGKEPLTSLENVDDKWIAHHSQQVTRMLPGGLDVIGIYALRPPDQMKSAQLILRQCLYSIKKKIDKIQPENIDGENSIADMILLQICTVTKKLTCRTYDVGDQKCSPRPADWKFQSVLSRWIQLCTSISVDITIQVQVEDLSKSLEKQIQNGLLPTCENIMNSLALLDGKLLPNDVPLDNSTSSQGSKKGKKSKDDDPQTPVYNVHLLHGMHQPASRDVLTMECGARLRIRGTVCCRAFVQSKATAGVGILAIKKDAVRSLLFRCQLMCEDLADLSEEELDPVVLYESPLRVFAPLHKSSVSFCDYLFQDEGKKECLNRLKELLNLSEVTEDSIETDVETLPEDSDLTYPTKATLDVAKAGPSAKITTKDLTFNIIGAAIGGTIAVIAAGISFMYLGED